MSGERRALGGDLRPSTSDLRPLTSDVTIRPAEPRDANAIGRLGAMLVREHYDFDPLRFMRAPEGVERGYGSFLIGRLKDPESYVLVAERDGAIAGYVYGALEPANWMDLRDAAGVVHDIVVDPEHRRAGVGRLLMTAAFDWLREHGAPRVILSTAYRNESAQKLFASVGFRPTMIEMTREL